MITSLHNPEDYIMYMAEDLTYEEDLDMDAAILKRWTITTCIWVRTI